MEDCYADIFVVRFRPCPVVIDGQPCPGQRMMSVALTATGEEVEALTTGPKVCDRHPVAYAPFARIGRFVVDGRLT